MCRNKYRQFLVCRIAFANSDPNWGLSQNSVSGDTPIPFGGEVKLGFSLASGVYAWVDTSPSIQIWGSA